MEKQGYHHKNKPTHPEHRHGLCSAANTQSKAMHSTCGVAAIFFRHAFCGVFSLHRQHIAILIPLRSFAVAKSCATLKKPNKKSVTPTTTTVPSCRKKNVGSLLYIMRSYSASRNAHASMSTQVLHYKATLCKIANTAVQPSKQLRCLFFHRYCFSFAAVPFANPPSLISTSPRHPFSGAEKNKT